ncbi:Ribosome-releasing factor 2, mitochondrial, partial [Coemansia sp. RSA 2603]
MLLGVLRLGARTRPARAAFLRCYSSSTISDLQRVRNIGIIAHIDAGKTTTTERMLHYAGFTRRIGDVDSGDTVMDYLAAERARGITIQSAAITFGWRSHQVHLIDTPGHVDFTVEVERAMRVLDGAVTIVDAVAGVQAQTRTVWGQAARHGVPQVVYVNKMDREGALWERCVEDVRRRLDVRPLVLMVPESTAGDGCAASGRLEGGQLERWLDAVSLERITYDLSNDPSGATVHRRRLTTDDPAYARACAARERLVEALGEVDERLVDVFMGDSVDGHHERVPAEEVRAAIRRATLDALACPVLLGASYRNIGVQMLLDAVVDYLPSPADRPAPTALLPGGKSLVVQPDGAAKVVAFAFKVTVDAQRGPLVFVRVYSGTLSARTTLLNTTRGVRERAMRVAQMYGDALEEVGEIACGHIGVVLGLKATRTGDTLVHSQHTAKPQLHGIQVPAPVFFCSVEADSPADERPLADALKALTLEDPSLHVTVDGETGQTLVQGMGELHLDVVRDRLVSDMRVRASFGKMRVALRESPARDARALHELMRPLAGRPAHVTVELE